MMKDWPRFPRTIQIQTMTGCNGACIFCPYPKVKDRLQKGRMDVALFEKIIEECRNEKLCTLGIYLMNEPLLDKKIFERIEYARGQLPDTDIYFYTNAALLTEENALKLVNSGLDKIFFSIQGITKETYESTMLGLNYDRVMNNVHQFIRLKENLNAEKPVIQINQLVIGHTDKGVRKAKKYWKRLGIHCNAGVFQNRAQPSIADPYLAPFGLHSVRYCWRPFKQMYISFDGDAVICSSDWEKKHVLGNVGQSGIRDVWNNAKYVEARKKINEGHIDEVILCKDCKEANLSGRQRRNIKGLFQRSLVPFYRAYYALKRVTYKFETS